MITHIPASSRGHTQIGWLDSWHSFSFGEWYDPARMGFGALRVFNDDRIAGGSGFPPHPHRDMEIISIVLEGGLAHQDSMGNTTTITPEMVQVMSAGSGLQHAEYNAYPDRQTHFLQLRIQPHTRGITPRHEEKKLSYLTHGTTMIASGELRDDAVQIMQDAQVMRVRRDRDDRFDFTLAPGQGLYVFVISGEVSCGDVICQAGDAMTIVDEQTVSVGGATGSDVVIVQTVMN